MKAASWCGRGRAVVTLLIVVLASLGAGHLASAHTDFDSSSPADGAVIDGPVAEVVVNFTNPAQPAGEEFVLLDPTGALRTPSAVDATDGTSFVLSFDPALEAGTYGLRWSVRAGDAHPISGSFTFDVVTPDPTPAASAEPSVSTPASPAPTSSTPVSATPTASTGESLDGFLRVDAPGDDSTVVGRVGRSLTMLGVVFGVGVLAALIWTIRGDRDELATYLNWVRLAGLVIFTGGLIEYAALAESDPTASFGTLMSTRAGAATALKMAGGLAVMIGFHQRAGRLVAPAQSLSAGAATDLAPAAAVAPESSREHPTNLHRWSPTTTASLGLVGYALVLVSFWFDGHTVSKGPWAVHSLVNAVHLVAAAVWGGGVFAMASIAWSRRRRSERRDVAAMVVRFSSIATVSLVAVVIAGLAMAWLVLDAPGDLVGTPWGRVLLAKTVAVAVIAGIGAYNHLRLRPALEQRPDDPELAEKLRISLLLESIVFVAVVVLTAVLVASAT